MVLGIKEGSVECATVCVKSLVILKSKGKISQYFVAFSEYMIFRPKIAKKFLTSYMNVPYLEIVRGIKMQLHRIFLSIV